MTTAIVQAMTDNLPGVGASPSFGGLGMVRGVADLNNATALYSLNRITSTATLTIGTTTTKVRTTATAAFILGGAFQTAVASTDDVFTFGGATSATTVAISSWQKYILLWDSTGASAPFVYEGVQSVIALANVAWTNINAVSPWGPLISLLNNGYVVVGIVNVATDTTHTFIPGTTAFGAAGITTTYTQGIDASLLPLVGNGQGSILGSAV